MILSVSELSRSFGALKAVNNVSFQLRKGEILGLIGPNGSGKSTTLSLIAGSLKPTSGRITLNGSVISGLASHQVCRSGVGRTFQIPRPFKRLTLLETVSLSAASAACSYMSTEEAEHIGNESLGLVGLPQSRTITVHGLGAAALKKLELAKALATNPRILLADESLGGLDLKEMQQAAELLLHIREIKGISIIWVEHIMGVLMKVVDRLIVLDHGEKIFDGLPRDAAHDKQVVSVYLGSDGARRAENAKNKAMTHA